MVGTLVNTGCIIVGSIVGSLLKKGLSEKYTQVLFNAMGLVSLALGASTFTHNIGNSEYPVLFILSLAIGGIIGTALKLDDRTKNAIARKSGNDVAKGLISSCLLYCIGTFSIVGPMLSALKGDNTFLFTNATLDLVTSTVFAATYGPKMIFAAPVLFCWQSMFYLIAKLASTAIPEGLVCDLSVVGGVLIISSGLSILNIKECKTLNYLPSLLVPPLWFLAKWLIGMI